VALHAAASTADRISFHILNRRTGHRVSRVYLDAETERPVEREDQVKGYETDSGRQVILEPKEIAAVVPESDKVLTVEAFVACGEVDTLYLDRPYFLTPSEESARTAFAVVRDGLARKKVAAVARTVLFRRVRSVLIRAAGDAILAHTLEYGHEVRDAAAAFSGIAAPKIDPEMLELAEHIIATKRGKFDPSKFEDRYDDALAELVKAKAAGKPLPKPEEPKPTAPIDLMAALRGSTKARKPPPKQRSKPATPRRKAG